MDATLGANYAQTGAGKRQLRSLGESFLQMAESCAKRSNLQSTDLEFAVPKIESLSLQERNDIWLETVVKHECVALCSAKDIKGMPKGVILLVMSVGDSRTPGEICARRVIKHGEDDTTFATRLTMGSSRIDEPGRLFNRALICDNGNCAYVIGSNQDKTIIAEAIKCMETMAAARASAPTPAVTEVGDIEPPYAQTMPTGANFGPFVPRVVPPRPGYVVLPPGYFSSSSASSASMPGSDHTQINR